MAIKSSSKKPSASAKKSTSKQKQPSLRKARVISSKIAYKGKLFSIYTDKVEEPGGIIGERDIIRHNGSVVILGVDETTNPDDPLIIVERQYRHAAGQFLLELPAGRLDPGERPLAGAKRELIEETGYRSKKWSQLVRYYASPGFLGESMDIWIARDIVAGKAEPEDDERIDVELYPLSKLLALIYAGKIHDGKTIIGTLLYDAQRRKALAR